MLIKKYSVKELEREHGMVGGFEVSSMAIGNGAIPPSPPPQLAFTIPLYAGGDVTICRPEEKPPRRGGGQKTFTKKQSRNNSRETEGRRNYTVKDLNFGVINHVLCFL